MTANPNGGITPKALRGLAEHLKTYAKDQGVQGFGVYLDGTYAGVVDKVRVMRGGQPMTLDRDEWERRIRRMTGKKLRLCPTW